MGLVLTFSDYGMFDGVQSGTYTQVATSTTITIANATGLGPRQKELPTADGYIRVTEQAWHLPVTQMGSIVPAEGDFYTDANGVKWYLINDIDNAAAHIIGTGQMYRVITRQGRGTASPPAPSGGASGQFGPLS